MRGPTIPAALDQPPWPPASLRVMSRSSALRRRRLRQDRHSHPSSLAPTPPATKVAASTSPLGASHSYPAQARVSDSVLEATSTTTGTTTRIRSSAGPSHFREGGGVGAEEVRGSVVMER